MKRIAVLAACLALAGCFPNYSDGMRVGTVTKFSHKGLIWKSWEGELVQGGVKTVAAHNHSTALVANVMPFNVDERDHKTIAAVSEAMKSGGRVEVVYRQWFIEPLWIDSDHVVYDVRPAE